MQSLLLVLRIFASQAVVDRALKNDDARKRVTKSVIALLKLMAASKTLRREVEDGEASDVFNELFGFFFNNCVGIPREVTRLSVANCVSSKAGESCCFVGHDGKTHGRGCCHDYVDTVCRWIRGAQDIFKCPVPGCAIPAFRSMTELHAHQFHCVRRWGRNRFATARLSVHRQLDQAIRDLSSLELPAGKRPRGTPQCCKCSQPPAKKARCFGDLANEFNSRIERCTSGPHRCRHAWCVVSLCEFIKRSFSRGEDPALLRSLRQTIDQFHDGARHTLTLDNKAKGVALAELLREIDVELCKVIPTRLGRSTLSFACQSALNSHKCHDVICGDAVVAPGDTLCVAMRRSFLSCRAVLSLEQKQKLWRLSRVTLPTTPSGGPKCRLVEFSKAAGSLSIEVGVALRAHSEVVEGRISADLLFAKLTQFLCPATKFVTDRVCYVRALLSLSVCKFANSKGAWKNLKEFALRLCGLPGVAAASLVVLRAAAAATEPATHSSATWWMAAEVVELCVCIFDVLVQYSAMVRSQLRVASGTSQVDGLEAYGHRWCSHLGAGTANEVGLVAHVHQAIGGLQIGVTNPVILGARAVCASVASANVPPACLEKLVATLDSITEPFRHGGDSLTLATFVASHRTVERLLSRLRQSPDSLPLAHVVRCLDVWRHTLDTRNAHVANKALDATLHQLFTDPAFLLLPPTAPPNCLRVRTAAAMNSCPMHIDTSLHEIATTTTTAPPPVLGPASALRGLVRCVQSHCGVWGGLGK